MTQKLIVQPIVENALYHAIERMTTKGEIVVKAMEDNKDIVIFVIDNGPGMSNEALAQLGTSRSKKRTDSGVGLQNVHNRLSIRFGQHYGVIVCSALGQGTTVQIRIPKIVVEERTEGLQS
jgi:two-component system, sensor histidine kinase YesM